MAKKKEFFSTFDKNLSIKEEATVIKKQVPQVVQTAAKTSTEVAEKPAPVPSQTIAQETMEAIVPVKKLIKKKPKPAPTAKLVKNTNPARPATFRIDVALMEEIKAVAYWERQKIQDVLDNALRAYISEIPKQELAKAKKAYSSAN